MLLNIIIDTCEIVALAEHPDVRHTPDSAVPVDGDEGRDSGGLEEAGVVGLSVSFVKGGCWANIAFKGGKYALKRYSSQLRAR